VIDKDAVSQYSKGNALDENGSGTGQNYLDQQLRHSIFKAGFCNPQISQKNYTAHYRQ
jgi:hypothetical protein